MQTTMDHVNEIAGTPEAVAGREQDFAALYRDLVQEAGRALEAGEEAWCALLQEVFIPRVEPEGLRALAALGEAGATTTLVTRTA